jgi:dinuclear metal center YbgI/SA1388 family protein
LGQKAALPGEQGVRRKETMNLDKIVNYLDEFLNVKAHGEKTGLKITGKTKVRKLAAAVDLSLKAIDQAKKKGCDFLITHHDAWKSTDAELAEKKVHLLNEYEISTYVSHDPLDAHSEIGTSISLARALNWFDSAFFLDNIGVIVEPNSISTFDELIQHIEATLGTKLQIVRGNQNIGRVAIIAGWGARPVWMSEAKAKGATTFLSGEAIHFGKLYAKESGMNLILAGHYATELPAIEKLLECIGKEFGIETELIVDKTSALL